MLSYLRLRTAPLLMPFRRLSSAGPSLESHDAQLLRQTIALFEDSLGRQKEGLDGKSATVPGFPHYPPPKTMDIKLSLVGSDCSMLDAFARFCINSGRAMGAHLPGPTPLPLRTQKWTVLSSPHVHKTAWTQLERRTHGRALRVYGMIGELLRKYIWYLQQHCPPDVQMECQLHEYIPLEKIVDAES